MPVLRFVLLVVGLLSLLAGSAQAAPVGALKQYRVPTANSQPRAITNGSDGNRWFTEGTEFTSAPAKIARARGAPPLCPHTYPRSRPRWSSSRAMSSACSTKPRPGSRVGRPYPGRSPVTIRTERSRVVVSD